MENPLNKKEGENLALKDTWEDLQDAVAGVENSGSDITVEPINKIARAVIDIEENGTGSSITTDTEMSDTSENAVQNKVIKSYVDGKLGDIETALDGIISLQNSLIGGEIE